MDFDWTKPMIIDWSGRSGPLFTEHALENCVIKRIVNNTYCAPFCEKKYIREIPKWNPRDPYETDIHRNDNFSYRLFIPGNLMLPAFPQVSTLTRIQQQQGVRVLSAEYEYVQPHQYAKPSKMDRLAFQEFKELYEAEQKQYLNWAKLLWLNEGCLKALRPKPIIEQVYEAEFKMRAHEIQSWPQNYVLAAQIPLESNKGTFELELKANLLNVNVQDLPEAHYPKVMEKPLSILLNSCPMPEPCIDHICKFVLPHEESMSTLPLSEIHRDLADFASSHDCSVIASENALSCLLETDRKWHIPVSVIQVASSEHGDNRSIVVLGNEFAIQKTCATHRTYRAYKHLLRETFAPLTVQHDHQEKTNAKTTKPVNVAETKVSNEGNDNGKQLVDRSEPKKLVVDESTDNDPEIYKVNDLQQNYFNESDEDVSSDTERLIIADLVETNAEHNCSHDISKQNYSNNVFTTPVYSHVDRNSEFISEPSTTKFATPKLFEKNDTYTALLKTNKNTASKADKANQGYARLIEMKENTTSKITKATQGVTRKLPEMVTNILSETDEPTPGDARKWPEMYTNTLLETKEPTLGDARKLLEMGTNTLSETNEPTPGDARKLLEMDTNALSETNEHTPGAARKLLEMVTNTLSKTNEPTPGDARKLLEVDTATLSETNEPTSGDARKLLEMDTATLSETNERTPGDARKLLKMDTNTLSETNEPTPGAARKLLEMATNTLSKTNEPTPGDARKWPEMDTNTLSETNEPTPGDVRKLLEIDTNTLSNTNEPTPGNARKWPEMDTNTLSETNEPSPGDTRKGPEMTPILLETNLDHDLETSTRVCCSPTDLTTPINPSTIETKTSKPTYSNKHISNDTNTFEIRKPIVDIRTHNTKTMMRTLSDSEYFSMVKETVTATKLVTTGITKNSSYGSTSKEPVTGPSAGKRARTLLDQINLEHDYYQLSPETLESIDNRRLGVNNSKASLEEPDSKSSPGDSRRLTTNIESTHKSSVKKLSSSAPATANSKSKTPNSTYAELVRNVECNKSSARGKPGKINFSELFGDESDSEEPIHYSSNKSENAKEDNLNQASHRHEWIASHEIKPKRIPNSILDSYISIIKPTKTHKKKTSSSERTRKLSGIKKRPLKPCLRNTRFVKSINTTTGKLPSYSKTKLSEPIVIDSDCSTSISGSDEEEAILGFHNGSAVAITHQPKSSKKANIKTCQNDTFTRMCNVRPSQTPKRISKESVLKKTKTSFTKIQSNKKNNAMQSCLSLFYTTEEPDHLITDTKNNVALRSRRLSTRLQEGSEYPQKTNYQEDNIKKDCSIIVERRSICLHSEESNENNTNERNDTKTNEQNDNKTKQVALKKSRRVSTRVQAEENYEPHKNYINEPNDTKTNEQNDTKTKQVALRRSRRVSTRVQVEENYEPNNTKTNEQNDTKTKQVALRSRRVSTRVQAEENHEPHKKNIIEPNDTKSNEQNDTKTKQVALRRSRRVSTRVQAEDNDGQHEKKTNEPKFAKYNEQNDTKTKQVALRRSRRLSTRVQAEESDGTHKKTNEPIEDVALSLDVSERTKRYLRRSLNFESSDSERESGDEVSKDTRKCLRGTSPSVSSSDAESNTEMNIFHFTTIHDTDTDDSDDENTLTIDVPPPNRTEESQATVIPGDKTRKIEMSYYTPRTAASTAAVTSTILPSTIQPKVETKPVDATRVLQDTHMRTNVGSRNRKVSSSEELLLQNERLKNANSLSRKAIFDVIGGNSCTCKGTKFGIPPPRSFKKWQLKNNTSNDAFDIIVHSSHKVRKGENEVILEPIVEFQPELGGSRQSESKLRALTLALLTRPLAQLVNVRVNHESGEVLVIEECGRGAGAGAGGARAGEEGEGRRGAVAGALHAALSQLRRLLPGQYVLTHDPSHGSNAMLYSTKGLASVHGEGYAGQRLSLRADSVNMADAEEALYAKIPPALAPVLLPYHKSRGMLPLAFTPLKKNVRAPKKITAALAKVKLPPHGIKWPKKKKKKKPRKLSQERQAELDSMPSEI